MGLGDFAVSVGMSVRRGTAEDLDWLVSELRTFSAFFNTKKPLFGDEEFVRQGMSQFIDKHVVFVAEKAGERAGFIAGAMAPHPFNPSIRVLSETFWWVSEEHRGSRAAALLFTEFLAFGKATADWVTMGLEAHSPVNPDALIKRGFKLQERCFLLEVE